MIKIYLLFCLFLITSCLSGSDTNNSLSSDKILHIFHSNNVNGETHPCGCRNFPLGGIAQVAGVMHPHKNTGHSLYIDAGDTFFPSTIVPDALIESQVFTANKLLEAFNQLGLNYFTPGDQDFALQEEFLAKLSQKAKFDFIMSNYLGSSIKHKKYDYIQYGKRHLIFIGVTDSNLLANSEKQLFSNSEESISKIINETQKKFKDKKLEYILISHSGLEKDEQIAKRFPQISWIIGSHTQSFLRDPRKEGQTNIVQVLSRNHYLGHIMFNQDKDLYKIEETRDETKNLWKKNPFISWLDSYKKQLDSIQEKESSNLDSDFISDRPSQTYQSCMECHEAQSDFWMGTSHSLALVTLHKNDALNNQNCIGCHSLDHNKKSGFTSKKNIIKTQKEHKAYWSDFSKLFSKVLPIKSLSQKQKKQLSKKWLKIDQKHELTHNFSNVQCLNCHQKADDHPFAEHSIKDTKDSYKKKCLSCHTKDQSIDWYHKDEKGQPTLLNENIYLKKLKLISCPKNEQY